MTALINKIDPNKHPRVYFGVVVLQKWIIPTMMVAFYLILLYIAATTITDGLELIDTDNMTPNEEGIYKMSLGAILLFGLLFMWRLKK